MALTLSLVLAKVLLHVCLLLERNVLCKKTSNLANRHWNLFQTRASENSCSVELSPP